MEEKINRKLLLMGFLTATMTLILTISAFFSGYRTQLQEDLRTELSLVAAAYEYVDSVEELSDFASPILRITLVDADGVILFETDADAAKMENHLERPEIRQAIEEGFGESIRQSSTLGNEKYYAAVKLDDGRILRCSLSANIVWDLFLTSTPFLLLIFIAVVILSVWLSSLLTKRLIQPIKIMAESLDDPTVLLDDSTEIYSELMPLIRELQARRKEIRENMMLVEHEHRRLTAILENMEEGLLLFDAQNRLLSANGSAARYLHLSGNVLGKQLREVNCDKRLSEAVEKASAGLHTRFDMELEGRRLRIMVDPVVSGDEMLGTVCLLVDVTERHALEQMKQEFTANVSHELKTPLTSVSGYAEMIETGIAKPEDIPVFASRIRKEAARLLSLIGDIIMLSEIEETGDEVQKESVDLYRLARQCINELEPSAERRKVTLFLQGRPSTVIGNPTMLTELVYNLCDNAIRYNRENGTVTVTVGEQFLEVEDTGIGIPAEHQSRIFERFYRVDKSRSKETGGTGLGLAIVKHIAEVHRASLSLESHEGIGTTIQVSFEP